MDVDRLVAPVRARLGWPRPAVPGHEPALILLCGLPGTGKSYLASAIAVRHPVAVVRSDEVRKVLVERPMYRAAESALVYRVCHGLLASLLADGYIVVLDATNLARRGRKVARRIAAEAGAPTLTLHTVAPPEVVAERLRRRASGELESFWSDAGWQVYQRLAASLEPACGATCHVVDTSQDVTPALELVDAFLDQGHA